MTEPPPIPVVRPAPVSFEEPARAEIPRHWFAGSPVATHLANGVNLLFPAGERFFIRSVKRYMGEVEDPLLRERVRAFFGQEGRHAKAHDDFFDVLEAQGFEVRHFLRVYEAVAYGFIEKVAPPALRLSTTVALEHYTALMAEGALTARLLDHVHPALRELLYWHAAEEIEHKSVAFDVLAAVRPGYALRVAGLALGTACLLGFWAAGTAVLLAQDPSRKTAEARANDRRIRGRAKVGRRVFLRGIREYLRPGFHPDDIDNASLAREHFASRPAPA